MGIEVSTYISGLTATWPPSGDPKSQGDDHIRLIKGVLQSTFPNASKPFYFPSSLATGTLALTAAQAGMTLYVVTSSGDTTITLPPGLTPADAGWSCEVMKYEANANAAIVVPASGSISTQFGSVASVRVGAVCLPVKFNWTGTAWVAVRSGPMIGSTVNFDGLVPWGFLVLDGSTFSAATYAELALALGTTTLKDKRGRTEIGAGTGSGLTNRGLGTAYGVETFTLSATHLPPQTPAGSITTGSVSGGGAITNAATFVCVAGAGIAIPNGTLAAPAITGTWSFNGTPMPGQNSTPFASLQPSIGVNKTIRAA